jgi:hypothetical protein
MTRLAASHAAAPLMWQETLVLWLQKQSKSLTTFAAMTQVCHPTSNAQK